MAFGTKASQSLRRNPCPRDASVYKETLESGRPSPCYLLGCLLNRFLWRSLKSVATFNPSKNLHRSDIALFPAGWVITVNRRSKTIQFSQRVLTINYHPFLATRCAPIQLCSMPSSLFLPPCLVQPLSYQHPPARVSFLSRMESSTVLFD